MEKQTGMFKSNIPVSCLNEPQLFAGLCLQGLTTFQIALQTAGMTFLILLSRFNRRVLLSSFREESPVDGAEPVSDSFSD